MKRSKKMKKVLLTAALVMVATSAFASNIAGTKHNLRSTGGSAQKGTSDEICRYCHTPHNAPTAVPLWTRAAVTVSTKYASPTLNATVGNPAGISLLCLSCHDSNINAQVADASITLGAALGSTKQINDATTGMNNDHPVSFTYDGTLAGNDGALVTPVGGKVGGTLPLFGAGADQLECASCHSVHDNTNSPFLRVANTGSALCLT